MDTENQTFNPSKPAVSGLNIETSGQRSKTALRMRYEAEVSVIRKKLGDLEDMRKTLNLTQRKMAQLLLVDPSAWTRWTRSGESAPPHIYRMLQWYLALEDKYPALDPAFWLSAVGRIREPDQTDRIDRQTNELLKAHESLQDKFESLRIESETQQSLAANSIRRLEDDITIMIQSSKKARPWSRSSVTIGMLLVLAFVAGCFVRSVFR